MRPDILERWPQISAILDELLPLDVEARRSRLNALPADQVALKPTLERLLAGSSDAARFFDQLPIDTQVAGDARGVNDPMAGSQVGPFRLTRLIGRGGMGTVWLAQRIDDPAQLPVAVKLPRIEAASTQIAERFEHERQILAALNHPNIARFYEAGVSPEGQLYIALEYVEGESLLSYCERAQLGVRERLALFLQVLRAVQYAHTILVLHRDLKPSNIIVTAAGEVKLLDFGIAKLMDRDTQRAEHTSLTQAYGQMMTPDFASPEQIRGEPLTVATDVYSLGVILFELLTGARPYRLGRGTRAQLEKAILTAEHPRPSEAVSAEFPPAARASELRWRHALRGDLDTLVLKALQKSCAARYPSVEAFALDCERHLHGLPLLAHAPRRLYRVGKFVGRHRIALGAAAAVLLTLAISIGTALRHARPQATVTSVSGMSARALLIGASERLRGPFGQPPSVQLDRLNTVAGLLRDVEEYDRSAILSRDARDLAKKHALRRSDAYVETLIALGSVERVLGNGAAALQARDESLALLDARGDHDSLLRARASVNTVAQFAQDPDREIALIKQGVALYERRYPTDPGYFNALLVLGNLVRTEQSPAAAIAYFQRAIDVFAGVGSRDYANLGASHGFLALCEFAGGRVGPALAHYAHGLELLERHAGPTALVTRLHQGNYAAMLHQSGRPLPAQHLFGSMRDSGSDSDPTSVDFDAAVYEAAGFVDEGRAQEAQLLLEPYSDTWQKYGGGYVENGERWVSRLALAQAMQGHIAQSRSTLSQHPTGTSAGFAADAAWVELAAGDLRAAAQWLHHSTASSERPPRQFDAGFVSLVTVASSLALRRGEFQQALQYADQAAAHLRDTAEHGGFPYLESMALKAQGEALLALGRVQAAATKLDSAVSMMRSLHSTDSPWLLDAIAASSVACSHLNNPRQARTLAAEARAMAHRHSSLAAPFLVHLTEAERLLR